MRKQNVLYSDYADTVKYCAKWTNVKLNQHERLDLELDLISLAVQTQTDKQETSLYDVNVFYSHYTKPVNQIQPISASQLIPTNPLTFI